MYRDLGDVKASLLQAAIELGAAKSVSSITSRSVASLCNISTGTIFNYFPSMKDLIDAAAQSFDRLHMDETVKMAQQDLSIEEIWDLMIDNFLSDPNGTLYYISYTNTFGFDPTSNNIRAEEFLEIAKSFFRTSKSLTDDQYLLLWDYITSMAFYYAEKFIHGYLDYDDYTKAQVKAVVFGGVSNFIN